MTNNKWTFKISLLIAFVTHCVLFFGGAMSVNEDNFTIYREAYRNAQLGRWVCDVLYNMGIPGPYRVQSWIGIFVIIALAASATVVVQLLNIQKKITAGIAIFLLITFPTLAYSYGYLYDSVMYTFALLFAALAVWLTNKKRYGIFFGAICIMLSLGLYQAWVSFAVSLVMLYVIVQIIDEKNSEKDIIRLIIRNAIMGILGGIFYWASVRIYNAIFGLTLLSYKGLDSMGKISLFDLPSLIWKCYISFAKFFAGKFYYMSKPLLVLNLFCIMALFLISIKTCIGKIHQKRYIDLVIYLIFILSLPMGTCLMDIVASTDTLSIYSICLVYILLVRFLDKIKVAENQKILKTIKYISCGCIVIIATSFFYLTQMYYFKLHVFYQRTYGIANRVVTRIEELDEYPQIRKVGMGGTPKLREDYGNTDIMFDDVIYNDRGLWGQYVGLSTDSTSDYALSKSILYMNGFLGTNYEVAKSEEILKIFKTEAYLEMPVWPAKDSVKVIDDIIMVKMDDYCWIQTDETNGKYSFSLQGSKFDDCYYVWQLYKNESEIENNTCEEKVCDMQPKGAGTYFLRVHIKDKETDKTLASITGEEFEIK